MRTRLRRFALLIFIGFLLATVPAPSYTAADELEEIRGLLQQGLTIHELDREIAGLSVKELQMTLQIVENQERLKEKDEQVKQKREHVKHVLRAYYNGGRKPVWAMLLSVSSWRDALYVLEQTQIVAKNDKRAMDRYMTAYKEMKTATEQLEASRTELRELKARFEAQKAELKLQQEELDRKLAALPVGNTALEQINDSNKQWQEKGLPQVRVYFSALAENMKKLQELIDQKPEMLVLKGRSYSFQLKDTDFNDFLHAKSKELETLSFTFEEGKITVLGKQEGTEMRMVGRYELEETKKEAIHFLVDELWYNGLQLPPGTVNELKETNDLSFYPSKIASYLQATSVQTTLGKLTIDLKLNF
ncbi:coiled-coil domain-containing protein [Paenibacillus sp. HJGM_3]|uniref:coiled-coil domain-containing protein n=1 Tax=Paenibacillus sp. HJGM_3 TaxID=3379816 RepID=UPI003859D099